MVEGAAVVFDHGRRAEGGCPYMAGGGDSGTLAPCGFCLIFTFP
jgi:hypothetical protein